MKTGDLNVIKIFNHFFYKRALLQIFFDLGLVVFTVIVSIFVQVEKPDAISLVVISMSVLLATGILCINAGLGFYQRVHCHTLGQLRARALLSVCLSLPLAYGIFHLLPVRIEDERIFVLALVAGVGVMLIHRIYVTHAAPQPMRRQRVLVFGSGMRAKLVSHTLRNFDPSVDLVGCYASPTESVPAIVAFECISAEKTLTEIVISERIDEIVVALSERRGGSMPLRELLDCKLQGVRVVDIAAHFEKTMGQIRLESVSAGWLIFGDGFEQGLIRSVIKRMFDLVCAAVLIVLAFPTMLLTMILIYMESKGPIFYFQERVGLNGRLFNVVKFRSMCTDAEKDRDPQWASVCDARITRVGRVIRKLRIDELPQLFSVLNGDMSLVGPRPERPYFVTQLTKKIPYYAVRQSVKPGVTGWAQVRYHYGASMEDSAEKLQYDLYYVKHHSLFLDLVVLFETVGVVVTGKGAY
jgi:sugar transferase (PEP-CTERM system associated)